MFSERKVKNNKERILQTVKISLVKQILFRKQKTAEDIACPLFSQKGSLTVETALILPLFLIGSLTLLSFVDVIRNVIEKQMRQQEILRVSMISVNFVTDMAEGSRGDYITLDRVYAVTLPIGGFGLKKVYVRQRNKVHIFNGYDASGGDIIGESTEYVYITTSGSVYHKTRLCQSLNVQVEEVNGNYVHAKRNTEGKKYQKCRICIRGYTAEELRQREVYVTNYGTKYHIIPNCSELSRLIQIVTIEEAAGRSPCRFCG